jgi:Bacterial SH3 domain
MNNQYSIRWTFLAILLTTLAACSPKSQLRSIPQAWIDAPLDGMILPLAPYEFVAHASDPTGMSRIEFSINGAVIGNVAGSGPLLIARQGWTPAAPGEYVVRARGANLGGTWSEFAEVRIVVQGQAPSTLEPTIPLLTATPTVTPTLSSTATPSVPTLTLIKNANCRRGPGQIYDVLTSLLAGQAVPIVGKNEDATWWLVHIPTGERCWISAVTGNVSGDINAVPIAAAPPTPAPGIFQVTPAG